MDSFKTGEFIRALRAEKGLTQKELAKTLNCTDKAISRWETGKGFPDIIFLTPLAQALEVSVNEILLGERICKEDVVQKSDETIINTMKKAENDKKIFNRIVFVCICILQIMVMYIAPVWDAAEIICYSSILFSFCAGFLSTKLKYLFPLINLIAYIPSLIIYQHGGDIGYSPLYVGAMVLFSISALKAIVLMAERKWLSITKTSKRILAIVLAIVFLSGSVLFVMKTQKEKIDVIEHIYNQNTYIDELIYNGTTYYPCNADFIRQEYNDYLDSGELWPRVFPDGAETLPYQLDETIDLSICTEYLPKLEENQKYYIPEDKYFIYANDSVTTPALIYIYEDSSYFEWYISENFDFTMPTTETYEIADIVLYKDYNTVPVQIKDKKKINEIITAKNNNQDISQYVTVNEFGEWSYIFIRYEDSPFIERIGTLLDDGIFHYDKSWQEKYKEQPHWYYVANQKN